MNQNTEIKIKDISLSESLNQMTEWRHKRYGLSSPKSLQHKLSRSIQIVFRNKLNFFLLLLGYFAAETIGNAALLVFQWTIDKDSPKTNYLILVQLTANWPVRLWRSILNTGVIHVVLGALKRRGHVLQLSDLTSGTGLFSWRMLILMFVTDVVLSSSMSIAQALLSTDIVWAIVYMVSGFILNWLFGMAQVLLFEDPNLNIASYFIWSATAALTPSFFFSILSSCVCVFFLTPLIITTPVLLVLQMLTFFEVFGFSSPAEVHYTANEN